MTNNKIQTIIDNFIADITAAVREEALDAISEAFVGMTAKPAETKAPTARSGETIGSRLVGYLQLNPWSSFAEIATGLSLTTPQLSGALQYGMRNGKITYRGSRRRYRYALAVRAVEAA